MKKILAALICGGMLLCGVAAKAETVNFDDVVLSPEDYTPVPTPYGGFAWYMWFAVPAVSGGGNVAMSPGYSFIMRGSPFTFNDALLFTSDPNFGSLEIVGLDGSSNPIGNPTFIEDLTDTPRLYSFNWSGLAALIFAGIPKEGSPETVTAASFAVDDFSFTPVPLPASLLLLCSGLTGLACLRRKLIR